MKGHRIIVRACGAMETRQTTDLKIAGSTPARLVFLTENKRSQSMGIKREVCMYACIKSCNNDRGALHVKQYVMSCIMYCMLSCPVLSSIVLMSSCVVLLY